MADPVTLTPEQLEAYKRADSLLADLLADGELGSKVRAAAKKKFNLTNTIDDQAEPIVAPLRQQIKALEENNKAMAERLEKKDKEDQEKAAEVEFTKKLGKARDHFKLTDEGVEKVIARMKETQNYTDVMGAAAFIVSETPQPKPVVPGPSWLPQRMNLFGTSERTEAFELLHKDPQKYQDRELSKFVSDPDGYVRETNELFGS